MNTPVYEYVSSQQEYVDAQRLHRRNRRSAALRYYLVFWLVPLLSVLFLLFTVTTWTAKGMDATQPFFSVAGLALYLVLFLTFALWRAKQKAWKTTQDRRPNNEPLTVQFDKLQIISAIPGVSNGRFFGSAFKDYAEDEHITLIYPRPKLFLFLPKRAMPASEWDRLRIYALPQKKGK